MARKMKTMDGNHAAAHAILCIHRRCSNLPNHTVICYGRSYRRVGNTGKKEHLWTGLYRLQRCSQRQVQQVLFTDLWQQEL